MLTVSWFHRFLADLILVVHFGYVLFVLGGFVMIWVGYSLGWHWVRHFWFRVAHLVAMGLVLIEALTGQDCPLTVWEQQLRLKAGMPGQYEGGFLEHWLGQALFYELPPVWFTVFYALFFCLIVLSWRVVKPTSPRVGGWSKSAD